MTPAQYLARLRALSRRLPDTGEKISWGQPTFTAGGRMFAAMGSYGEGGCIAIATSHEEQAFLVQDPRFAVAPYVGKQGWVVAWLAREPEWDLLEDLLCKAHARILAKAAAKPARRSKVGRSKVGRPGAGRSTARRAAKKGTKRVTKKGKVSR
ncbi:MAG: MmcQ/YjbR family DNA-binding protein [Planctomycetota bacterium]